jgi:hypothetical protein
MMSRTILCSTLIAFFTVLGSAQATMIGNATIARNQSTDGDYSVLNILNTPVPAAGQIDAFITYNMSTVDRFSYEAQNTFYFGLILRPTGNANEYTALYNTGVLHPFEYPVGVVSIPVGPISVQAGDLIASWGYGIPFDFGGENPQAIHYPFLVGPPSGTFTAGPLGQVRTYSFAADFNAVPEPSSFALTALAAFGLLFIARLRRADRAVFVAR